MDVEDCSDEGFWAMLATKAGSQDGNDDGPLRIVDVPYDEHGEGDEAPGRGVKSPRSRSLDDVGTSGNSAGSRGSNLSTELDEEAMAQPLGSTLSPVKRVKLLVPSPPSLTQRLTTDIVRILEGKGCETVPWSQEEYDALLNKFIDCEARRQGAGQTSGKKGFIPPTPPTPTPEEALPPSVLPVTFKDTDMMTGDGSRKPKHILCWVEMELYAEHVPSAILQGALAAFQALPLRTSLLSSSL